MERGSSGVSQVTPLLSLCFIASFSLSCEFCILILSLSFFCACIYVCMCVFCLCVCERERKRGSTGHEEATRRGNPTLRSLRHITRPEWMNWLNFTEALRVPSQFIKAIYPHATTLCCLREYFLQNERFMYEMP